MCEIAKEAWDILEITCEGTKNDEKFQIKNANLKV
jgi:hypothetical protein